MSRCAWVRSSSIAENRPMSVKFDRVGLWWVMRLTGVENDSKPIMILQCCLSEIEVVVLQTNG